jgi:hypothetical protein
LPEISRFLGIAMYYNDHNPPHFHARSGAGMAGASQGGAGRGLAPGSRTQEAESDRTAGVNMLPKLENVEYLGDYRLRIRFADGVEGAIDLEDGLWGEMFEPLKDRTLFSALHLDPDLGTIVWPNGADLAPEFLYARLVPGCRLSSGSGVGAA